jgi:hypothetical protein
LHDGPAVKDVDEFGNATIKCSPQPNQRPDRRRRDAAFELADEHRICLSSLGEICLREAARDAECAKVGAEDFSLFAW